MIVSDLVGQLAAAAACDEPLPAVASCLRDLAPERARVAEALSFFSGVGSDAEQAFYRAPNLSLLKVVFPPGRRTPPHDHGAWAAILLLSGAEQCVYWREQTGGGLVQINSAVTGPGSVSPMPADAIHTVECAGEEPAVGLHVYGTDLISAPRRVWDPVSFKVFDHSDEVYARLAARAAQSVDPARQGQRTIGREGATK